MRTTRLCARWVYSTILALILLGQGIQALFAGPFAKRVLFTQPGGTQIELWGQGDEFYAIFETLDGYTVMFDPAAKTYYFAQLSADGNDLVSSGLEVGQIDPAQFGLPVHLRINPAAAQQQALARYAQWDDVMQISRQWKDLKRSFHQAQQTSSTAAALATPHTLGTGTRIGLCLLIDFDDDPAIIPQADIFDFCNADSYTGYGNNGSVKKYFQDNSNGLLTYSNVVTAYIRIPNSLHPKSYYNDVSQSCFGQGNLLIRDAIAVMKALPNYASEILPAFDALTLNSSNQVMALNAFYAGGNGGVWAYGLWPHCGGLTNVGAQELSPGGKTVFRYQLAQMGTSLEMGLFCHENGHMLFGYPDLYDYGFDSAGGAGRFCIMDSGWPGTNPTQICGYLKYMCGWGTITELTSASSLTATLSAPVGTNFNHFYRYQKPGIPTEYFLIENRQQSGRDANIPVSGIAIWHADELGDHNNQSLVTNNSHANYEVTLVQADNRWDLEHNSNTGDANDLYYNGNSAAGYDNHFSDASAPNAHWWDGTASGANFHDFSQRGSTMTFIVEPSLLITSQPQNQFGVVGSNATFRVTAASTLPIQYQWRFNGANMVNETNSTLLLRNLKNTNSGSYLVVVSNSFLSLPSAPGQLTVVAPSSLVPSITANTFKLVLNGEVGMKYQVEVSTNLQVWAPYLLLTNATGQTAFSQTNLSSFRARFFRARLVP